MIAAASLCEGSKVEGVACTPIVSTRSDLLLEELVLEQPANTKPATASMAKRRLRKDLPFVDNGS